VWPGWPDGLTQQDSVKNSVATHWFFLLKRCHFNFF
jgi:hypothetical protein